MQKEQNRHIEVLTAVKKIKGQADKKMLCRIALSRWSLFTRFQIPIA